MGFHSCIDIHSVLADKCTTNITVSQFIRTAAEESVDIRKCVKLVCLSCVSWWLGDDG